MDVEGEKTPEVGTDGFSSLKAAPLGGYQVSNAMGMCHWPRFVQELHKSLCQSCADKGCEEQSSGWM